MKKLQITCFGEVLWDVFPNHKKIGGAPLNVALRLKSLGNNTAIISKVGKDNLGNLLLDFISKRGINVQNIQKDAKLKTGKVDVVLDKNGSASYNIMFPRAWDTIELTEADKKLVKSSDAFIFGSLIARNQTSKDTLINLINKAKYKIFDVNLRAPHYTKKLLIELMNYADFIKFNDDELLEISNYLGSEFTSIEENINFISDKTNTSHICVTKGKNGAVLFYNNQFYNNSGYKVTVKDTVGAGDSFLATLIHFLLKNEDPQKSINIACAFGALVAQSEGANPEIDIKNIENLLNFKLPN